jgi:valyl-tRNA synthetase
MSPLSHYIVKLTKKGRVDATAEISKLEKKQVLAEQNKAKLIKTTQQPGYEKTAKEEVRQQNQERVSISHSDGGVKADD